MLLLVENLIREYGMWAVFFGAMIEGELTLLFAGVLAHYGLCSFGEVFFCGTFGGFVGDSIGYWLGHTSKRSISACAFIQRAQPRMEKLSQRFGIYSIFLVKYIYGLRTASAVFWGFAQMRYRRFAPLTAISCMVWVGLLAGMGYFFSGAIELIIGRVQRIGLTPLTLLSPSWDSSVTSADGMNVYTLNDTPVVLLSDEGRMVRAHITADEVTP